ncbi:hypothetical protein CLOP_g6859, partial [Closterium sp. NIES-67]
LEWLLLPYVALCCVRLLYPGLGNTLALPDLPTNVCALCEVLQSKLWLGRARRAVVVGVWLEALSAWQSAAFS